MQLWRREDRIGNQRNPKGRRTLTEHHYDHETHYDPMDTEIRDSNTPQGHTPDTADDAAPVSAAGQVNQDRLDSLISGEGLNSVRHNVDRLDALIDRIEAVAHGAPTSTAPLRIGGQPAEEQLNEVISKVDAGRDLPPLPGAIEMYTPARTRDPNETEEESTARRALESKVGELASLDKTIVMAREDAVLSGALHNKQAQLNDLQTAGGPQVVAQNAGGAPAAEVPAISERPSSPTATLPLSEQLEQQQAKMLHDGKMSVDDFARAASQSSADSHQATQEILRNFRV